MSDRPRDYVAVIFTNQRPSAGGGDGYEEELERMRVLAERQPGYLGVEGARSPDGFGITVSYWESDEAARAWKRVAEHAVAQRIGRERWYEWYHLRVATVHREYEFRRSASHEQHGDEDDGHARPA